MKVWLLLIWVGLHQGYVSVPNLPSEEECKALYTRMIITASVYRWNTEPYCISYEVSK